MTKDQELRREAVVLAIGLGLPDRRADNIVVNANLIYHFLRGK